MGLLLYKSNEMFSSTELIRKSKMIFDKILGKKIEKAIILRDGKPSFLLMEFAKYEKIMAEYEKLKANATNLQSDLVSKKTKTTPKKDNNTKKVILDKNPEKPQELSQEQEIKKAYLHIDSMNLDQDLKKEAKEKIKEKIQQARAERAKMNFEDPKEQEIEKELQEQIKQEKHKKEQELEEFWDD